MAKIMLVEDDNNLREIYEARLAAEGYEIVSAQDGEEALALAVKERPDLIIADIMMPKVSGFDMLDILRSTPETKDTRIIMMTALSQAEDKTRAEKLGADRYLVKSQVTLEDVVKVAGEILSGNSGGATPPASTPTPALPPSDNTPTNQPSDDNPVNDTAPVAPAPVAVTEPPTEQEVPVTPAPTTSPDNSNNTESETDSTAENASETDDLKKSPSNEVVDSTTPSNPPLDKDSEEKPTINITPDGNLSHSSEELSSPTSEEESVVNEQIAQAVGSDSTTTDKPAGLATSAPTVSNDFTEEVIGAPAPVTIKPSVPTSIPVTVADDQPTEPPKTDKVSESTSNSYGTDADQSLANAIDNLVGDKSAPSDNSDEKEEKSDTKEETSDEPQLAKKRGGERVITPLTDPNNSGPDLQALLAKEEANDALTPPSANTVIAPGGTVSTNMPSDTTAPVTSPDDSNLTGQGAVAPAPPAENETPPANPSNIAL